MCLLLRLFFLLRFFPLFGGGKVVCDVNGACMRFSLMAEGFINDRERSCVSVCLPVCLSVWCACACVRACVRACVMTVRLCVMSTAMRYK